MAQNKTAAPVLAHRNGQKRAIAKKHSFIVPYLRCAVKMACVTLGIYITAAVAALNIPALLLGVLVLNALLGLYFRLEGWSFDAAGNP